MNRSSLLRHAPQDTTATLLAYHAWHLDCLSEHLRDAMYPAVTLAIDELSGVVEADWRVDDSDDGTGDDRQ